MSNLEVVKWGFCPYETVIEGVVRRCDRPCTGDYCLEHATKMREVDDIIPEFVRWVGKDRKK